MSYLRMVREARRKRNKSLNAANSQSRSSGTTYSQCLKKNAYAGYRAAQRASESAKLRGDKVRIYLCFNCDMYHLTKEKRNG